MRLCKMREGGSFYSTCMVAMLEVWYNVFGYALVGMPIGYT